MAQIVVTSGTRFTDLDALACALAYREVTSPLGLAVLPGPLNQSVSRQIRRWPLGFFTSPAEGDFDFVMVDVSEKSQFPPFVKEERLIEIYDHHFGFEEPWRAKLGEKAKIEEVGACATLIWEEFKERNPLKKISSLSANLLYTAVISNTLNLHSPLTTGRDRQALEEVKAFTSLPVNWVSQYYLDLEAEIYRKPETVIRNDTKIQNIRGIKCAFSQVELWNSRDFLKENGRRIEAVLREYQTETWLFNSPCLSEGRSYIFTKSEVLKDYLRQVMTIVFEGDIGITDKLWLRKEILKKIQ